MMLGTVGFDTGNSEKLSSSRAEPARQPAAVPAARQSRDAEFTSN